MTPPGSTLSSRTPFMRAAMAEEIPPGNPVLRGQHHGLPAHDRGQIGRRRGDLMRLHAEDDQILQDLIVLGMKAHQVAAAPCRSARDGRGDHGADRAEREPVVVFLWPWQPA